MWVIWVDVAAVVIGIGSLTTIGLRLYRRIKKVNATIGEANATIGELTSALEKIGPRQ